MLLYITSSEHKIYKLHVTFIDYTYPKQDTFSVRELKIVRQLFLLNSCLKLFF